MSEVILFPKTNCSWLKQDGTFETADDEMVQTYILKIVDYDALQNIHFPLKTYVEQNVKIYNTDKEKSSEGTK